MSTTPEAAMAALVAAVEARRDVVLPAALVIDGDPSMQDSDTPSDGQVGIFMTDRGASDGVDGGPYWRETEAQIECLVQGSTASERRARLRALLDMVETALTSDRSLGGVVVSCTYEALDPGSIPVDGDADAASEAVLVTLEYHSETQL